MSTPAQILVVDDEPDLLDNIRLLLEVDGFGVFTAEDGAAALAILEAQPIDLILADIAMPNLNGYQLYEKVRENSAWVMVPFIFLSARSLDTDIHYGKELGVDDYLTKPIHSQELLAAVRGRLRRAQQIQETVKQIQQGVEQEKNQEIELGPLQIDSQQHRVWNGNREVKLSAREFLLLEYLARQQGRVVAASDLIKITHDLDTDQVEAGSLIRPLILSLRRKLKMEDGQLGSIENVRGVGYRMVAS